MTTVSMSRVRRVKTRKRRRSKAVEWMIRKWPSLTFLVIEWVVFIGVMIYLSDK